MLYFILNLAVLHAGVRVEYCLLNITPVCSSGLEKYIIILRHGGRSKAKGEGGRG